MKRRLAAVLLGLSVALTSSAAIAADEATAPSAVSPAAAAPGPKLTGSWGIGFDSIRGASTNTGLITGLATPNALAVRYWVNERLAWDGLLALDLSSLPAGSGGVTAGTDQRGFGVGTVIKWNVKRPTPWLLAQLLCRASLAQLQQVSNSGGTSGQTTSTFGLGLGAGFEAFLPFWEALSVEGSVGLDFSSSQIKTDGSTQAAQSGSTVSVGANGFTPLNVALHLYF